MSKSGEYNTVTLLYHNCPCDFNYLFTILPKATLFQLQKHLFHFYCVIIIIILKNLSPFGHIVHKEY